MKTVVITGSTKGIGYGLADSFLASGCSVFINSRNEEDINEALRQLKSKYSKATIYGQVCDVSDINSVQSLWDNAEKQLGKIDIWINNAGQSNPRKNFWEQDAEKIKSVVAANVLGAMNGSKVAISGMIAQGHGYLYNFLGFGSNGMKLKGFALYGATKYAMKYFTDSLKKEVTGAVVKVGSISPGMVTTYLLLGEYKNHPEQFDKVKRVFNILADKVETVTPWLVKKILENDRNGADIAWLTRRKIAWRFFSSLFHKRNII